MGELVRRANVRVCTFGSWEFPEGTALVSGAVSGVEGGGGGGGSTEMRPPPPTPVPRRRYDSVGVPSLPVSLSLTPYPFP